MNMLSAQDFERADILYYNGMTPTDRGKMRTDPEYRKFQAFKSQVFSDQNASIDDIMYLSA
jgi:hypothetical protein